MKYYKKKLKNFITIAMAVCFVIGSIVNYDIVRAADNQWVTEDFKLPVALNGAYIEYVDGKIYVIGGDKGGFSYVNTVHIYDFETKTWSIGSPMSQAKGHGASSVVDGKIYIFGGYRATNSAWYTVNDVEIYDIAENKWSLGTSMPVTNGHVKSIFYGDKIYLFGGAYNTISKLTEVHNTIQIYDPVKNIWSIIDLPFKRYGYTLDQIEDKVYLIGGHNGSEYCNDVKIYDLNSETWSEGSKMNSTRHYAISEVYNNKIYVFAGNNQNLLTSCEVYDVVSNTWSNNNNIITAKRRTNSIVANHKIYLIGGETNIATVTSTNVVESLQLPPTDNRLFSHLYINEKAQLSFSHDLTDNQNLTWKSSDTRVATVDSEGKVKALENGTTYISAYNQNGTLVDYIPVIVTKNDVYRIAVHLNAGQTLKLYMKGNPSGVTWSSVDNAVATVDSNGLVTGVSKGLAIVKSNLNGEEHYIYVRVN